MGCDRKLRRFFYLRFDAFLGTFSVFLSLEKKLLSVRLTGYHFSRGLADLAYLWLSIDSLWPQLKYKFSKGF
jgi:hypothetical protein